MTSPRLQSNGPKDRIKRTTTIRYTEIEISPLFMTSRVLWHPQSVLYETYFYYVLLIRVRVTTFVSYVYYLWSFIFFYVLCTQLVNDICSVIRSMRPPSLHSILGQGLEYPKSKSRLRVTFRQFPYLLFLLSIWRGDNKRVSRPFCCIEKTVYWLSFP